MTRIPCEGCGKGIPRVTSTRAMELLGVGDREVRRIPASWALCMRPGYYHLPKGELERLKQREKR